jgi:HPt (histidine-containing phosphotransfer) domain-containing protein
MSESLEQLMARLRAEYLTEVPDRLAELDGAIAAFEREDGLGRDRLIRLFHRLAGSAGAYGFGEVTRGCREAEVALKGGLGPADSEQLRATVTGLREAFARGPTSPPIAP